MAVYIQGGGVVKERSVIFKDEEVRATRGGRMTQFRRPVRNIRVAEDGRIYVYKNRAMVEGYVSAPGEFPMSPVIDHYSPYGHQGDRLYVKEAWSVAPFAGEEWSPDYVYRADGYPGHIESWKWKSSTWMPEGAARIFLEITDVRVERLQDIDEGGILDEGVQPRKSDGMFAEDEFLEHLYSDFISFWDSIAKSGERWEDNPWVWVYEFKVVTHAD
jgi:hypothetical protein